MINMEYKKINYIFSVNSNIKENIKKLSLTDKLKLLYCQMLCIECNRRKSDF